MKNLKKLMMVALLGIISYGAFSAFDYYTMTSEEIALLKNVEALTQNEGSGTMYTCYELISTMGNVFAPIHSCQPGGRCSDIIYASRYESPSTCTF